MTGEYRQSVEWPAYEVNEWGDVRRAKATRFHEAGSPVKIQRRADGYCYVHAYPGGEEIKNFLVHRMVANAFIGPPPTLEHTDCAHIDGRPFNNHVSNLRWSTRSENMMDMAIHDRYKLKNAEVVEIREKFAKGGVTRQALAREYGVSHVHVGQLIKGKHRNVY